MTCRVQYCDNPTTHTTKCHKCETCSKYGHGKEECNSPDLIYKLSKFYNEELEYLDQCKFFKCKYSKFHSTPEHCCSNCNDKLHTSKTCSLKHIHFEYNIICPLCKTHNQFNKNRIRGSNDECCICLSNKVELYFPCEHACMCIECANQINLNKKINFESFISDFIRECNWNIDKDVKLYLYEYPSYININKDRTYESLYIRRLNPNTPLEIVYFDNCLDNTIDFDLNNWLLGYAKAKCLNIHNDHDYTSYQNTY